MGFKFLQHFLILIVDIYHLIARQIEGGSGKKKKDCRPEVRVLGEQELAYFAVGGWTVVSHRALHPNPQKGDLVKGT